MGTVLSQLSNRHNQDMPSTRSSKKNDDGVEASKAAIKRTSRGRKTAAKTDPVSVSSNENKGNTLG